MIFEKNLGGGGDWEKLGGSGSEKLGEDGRGSGGVAQRNSEKLGEDGRRWEGGGRVQKKLPMGLDSFLSLLLV